MSDASVTNRWTGSLPGCVWNEVGTKCETHGCDFFDPCLKSGCPHCDKKVPTEGQVRRLCEKLQKIEERTIRAEARAYRALGVLVGLRRNAVVLRRRLARMKEALPPSSTE